MSIQDLNFAQRSHLFARLAGIAYSDDVSDVENKTKELGFTEVEFYNREGAQAYRFSSADDIVIACRGTQPTEFNDIAADLKAIPVLAETVSRVHRGFKAEVDELWPMVREDLEAKQPKQNVWFCGHSLGAAMATIMASRCFKYEAVPNPVELYTYGSPRVGWPGYVKDLGVIHHRWVNNNDVVTTVPPTFLGYRHDGTEHYLNSWGNVRAMTGWQRTKDKWRGFISGIKQGKIDNFSDHAIGLYEEYLKNYAEGKENPQV